MDELIYISTYVINFCLCAIAFAVTRSTIAAGGDLKVSMNRFAAVAVAVGLISGIPLLFIILWLFESAGLHVNVGHGEGLVATPLFNFVMGLLLAGLGRILLGWQTIRW
ncbi:hypothetical protein [Massilia horti]|uniref:Uncharacterized protein n=1 Tax=Massilia horti TaxID=2562153 RepID=A0A4Y9SSR0_9BURK|nr:hypothetical protein [Massilia horti]TFW28254.1 hypothetical protein E4O92_21635 [Massilia horti]